MVTTGIFLVEPSISPFSYRIYIHREALMNALAGSHWSDFYSDTFELYIALVFLNTNLTTVIDSLAPLKVVRPTKGFEPWMDAGLISLRCKRVAALQKYR